MKRKLDLAHWNRKEHFHFYKNFEEPFFGLCVDLDCTKAYAKAKEMNTSFFIYYLHKATAAANAVESFRYRIQGEEVIIYDVIDAATTVNRANQTFGFSYVPFREDYQEFEALATLEFDRVRNDHRLIPASDQDHVMHYTVLPWLKFTSFSHARSFRQQASIPKIAFGQLSTTADGRKIMPLSVHVHHALMDGFHLSQYINQFQALLNA